MVRTFSGHGCARSAARPLSGLVLVSLALTGPVALRAQGAPAGATADASSGPLTYSVPESPALTFLGISPAKVNRASSARDLGAALVNSIDSTGRVLTGVALGATIWTLLPDVKVGLTSYQRDWKAYALANAQLSLGSARASGDSADADVALGVRTTLADGSDPMRSPHFVRSLTAALTRCVEQIESPNLPPPGGSADTGSSAAELVDPALKCAEDANEAARARWFQDHWNEPALSWGAALGWRLPRSELGSMVPLGESTWLTGAYPLGSSGQLLAQLQFDHRNRRGAALGASNVLTYAARAVRGTRGYHVFLEVAGTQRPKAGAGVSRSNVQWSGGVELQVAEGYWLSTGFGKRYTAQGQPDRVVLIANLRWGISSKARLGMLPQRTPDR